MVEESIVDKIKERGYWRVNIRPDKFEKKKIDSLNTLKQIMSDCDVKYRGWPYPFIKEMNSGNDYIWGGVDWRVHKEYWRFYQSLQFVHLFVMREDWEELIESIFGEKKKDPRKPGTGLSVFSSLYTFAEIFEFTNRLIKKAPYDANVQIKVELIGTNGRKLFCYNPSRNISDSYISTIPEISYEKVFSIEDVLLNSTELALNFCHHFFERFNWETIPKDLLREEIYKYVSKKLPENMEK